MTATSLAVFVLGLVVIVSVALFVSAPLFASGDLAERRAAPSERDHWERQKRQALAAIKEVELDHEMGKLSGEDFDAMRGRFEAQALEAMAALDQEERGR
jgi:hypothetical protein